MVSLSSNWRIPCAMLIAGLALVEPAVAAKDSSDFLPISILAEFDHEAGLYKTLFGSYNSVEFVGGKSASEGVFRFSPEDCIGIAGWETGDGNETESIGPAIICMTNHAMTPLQLEQWLEDGAKSGVDPTLEIPVQGGEIDQNGRVYWVNTEPVTMSVFYQPCGGAIFRGFGTLTFEAQALSFTSFLDDAYQYQIELAGESANLDVSQEGWSALLTCLDTDALPVSSTEGVSIAFSGGSVAPPLDPKTVFGQFSGLHDLVARALHFGLPEEEADRLTDQLNKVGENLRRNRFEKTVGELDKFGDDVGKLLTMGLINVNDGEPLLSLTNTLEDNLRTKLFPQPEPLDPDPLSFCAAADESCPVVEDCNFETFYVDDDAVDPEPDGTRSQPFPSIVDALASASKLGLCGVTIHLAPGTYFGDLLISRHTRILGPDSERAFIRGSVVTRGPHFVEIARVNLFWFESDPADGVSTIDPCARVTLTDVDVLGFRGFGVRQSGGTLQLTRVRVTDTAARPEYLVYGTGVYLTCGVHTRFSTLALINNESSGLQIWGAGTLAEGSNLHVLGTGAHPGLAQGSAEHPHGSGGVVVRGEAELLVSGYDVSHSAVAGLNVNSSARALFHNGTVVHTVGLETYFGISGGIGPPYGNGVASFAEGRVTLVNFENRQAEECGVLLADHGQTDLRYGLIAGHPIGICLQVTGYDRRRLLDGVRFEDNMRDLEETDLPVPMPSSPVELTP